MKSPLVVHDVRRSPEQSDIERTREEVLAGLRAPTKALPSKLFYDETGSRLFEEITEQPEYYLTRTERSIFEQHIGEMVEAIGPESLVVEFGSGAGTKTRQLLGKLDRPVAYVPIEINREQLLDASLALVEEFPQIEIWPVCADFAVYYELPRIDRHYASTLVFFPGSTIGNFTPTEAADFLRRAREAVGPKGKLLIGVDLRKDRRIIEEAYNDAKGITAEFNRNILQHVARLFGTTIDTQRFGHLAFYNPNEGRIEMHLISHEPQTITLGEHPIELAAGEHIRTEYSYKYDLDQLKTLLENSGWTTRRVWTDDRKYFSITYATAAV